MDERKVIIEFSYQTIFWIIVAVLSLWLLVTLKDILVVCLLAFILAMAITPLVDYLQGKKIPRTLSITTVILAIVAILFLVIRIVVPPFASELTNMLSNKADYVAKITENFSSLSPVVRDNLTTFLNNFIGSFSNLNVSGVMTGAKGVFNGIVEVILVFVLCFYMLQNNKGVEGIVVAYIPKQHQKRTLSIYRKISKKMSSWLGGQAILGVIIFFVSLIGLSILKVEYALTLAIIAGLLEVLPIIGPVVAGGLAVLISLTQSPVLALIVLAFYVLVQQLENHILVPQVMKKSLGLNPIAVILAIIIGGKLLGFVGILISVPVAAAIGVLMEEFVKKQEEEAR
jgi:predicted PurR-regulated permease PerM